MAQVAKGQYLSLSEKRGAAVEINGKLNIYNGKKDKTFFQRLGVWICDTFNINAENPTIEIKTESISSTDGIKEIIINSNPNGK